LATWTADELSKIGGAEELELASRRRDRKMSKPVTIWVVRLKNDLYVRSKWGHTSTWFQGTRDRFEGHISAGGIDRDVYFEEVEPNVDDRVDAAYLTKYSSYQPGWVDPIVAPHARATTIRLVPLATT